MAVKVEWVGLQSTARAGTLPAESSASPPLPWRSRVVGAMSLKIEKLNLTGAEFLDTNLSEAAFTDINLEGARFSDINLSKAAFDDINLSHTTIRHANLSHVAITEACYEGMTIDGIPVTDLLAAWRGKDG